jgi:glutathione peroxidase
MPDIYQFSATTLDGRLQPLAEYAGKVLLIVNVASKCGFTPQYTGLQALHKELAPQGFAVLGFPCDQFGGQEPGTDAEIGAFCTEEYGITFPMFAKIQVNGAGAHPLYEYMRSEAKGLLASTSVKWNFTKFLVDRHGRVLRRYAPTAKPAELRKDIAALLG